MAQEIKAPTGAGLAKKVVAIVAAVALIGGGAGIALALSSSAGGASSPSGAVYDLIAAADHSDLLGVVDSLAPGERQAIEPGMEATSQQLERLGILSSDTNLAAIAGVGLHFSDIATKTVLLDPDLAEVSITGGKVAESVNPAKLPLGAFIDSLLGSRLSEPAKSTVSSATTGSTPIVTEKVDGSWYVSLGYSIAIEALHSKGLSVDPTVSGSIAPVASTSADQAVRSFLVAGAAFNLRGLIGVLAPGEMGALQTYAPDFLEHAQSALGRAQSSVHLEITTMTLSDSVVNGDTLVKVGDLGLKATIRGVTISVKGGCVTVTTSSGTTTRCPSSAARSAEEQRIVSILPPSLRPLATRLFSARPQVGIAAVNEDGGWYVSPVATMLDDLDAYLAILQPGDLVAIANLAHDPAEGRAILHAFEELGASSLVSGGSIF